ncbi:MAG: DNA repair protein RecO [Anaerovorax sp.]
MYIDTEGIILKQIKTVNGRRMVLLFSKKYGKISAGTSISEKGRSKSALAMRPFTYGRYELYKNRDSYNINGADVIKSYYKIGEDVEKYMYCSYVLEFTEKLIQEDAAAPQIFNMVIDFFDVMEKRSKKYDTLTLAYQVKALQLSGIMPNITQCVSCGCPDKIVAFDVKNGGILCEKCFAQAEKTANHTLIFTINFGIVGILKYILENPIKSFENLAIGETSLKILKEIMKSYVAYHLDISNLKSENFLIE